MKNQLLALTKKDIHTVVANCRGIHQWASFSFITFFTVCRDEIMKEINWL